MLQEPFTGVTLKLLLAPMTVGVTVPVLTFGPTDAGLLVQVTPTVYAPVTAHAVGECDDPL